MRSPLIAISVIIALSSSPAHSEVTGRTVAGWCKAKPESREYTACRMYVTGFLHGARMGSQFPSSFKCLPNELDGKTAIKLFVLAMEVFAEPNVLPLPDRDVQIALASTLVLAYKCPPLPN